jgi:flagellar protein FlgJ
VSLHPADSAGVALDPNRADKSPVSSPAAAVVSHAAIASPAAVSNPAASATDRKSRFIETMLPYAQEAEAATGVPARFILAQAALESGWGKREILAGDGTPSHNLFGIKATGWSGKTTEVPTTEYRQGLAMKVTQNFRAYADYGEAFSDYGNLLRRRYGDAVAAGNDAEAFASALANGGYATDPSYAAKLRGVIKGIAEVVA